MRLNPFSTHASQPSASITLKTFDKRRLNVERTALTQALHALLEGLPQSYNGRENIKRLCQTIQAATPHLRLVWVGFREGDAEWVEPYAADGDGVRECQDWRLPGACFDLAGSYSPASPEKNGSQNDPSPLFAPWRHNSAACSANGALAIPLRTEKAEQRGMMVFYADSQDYFSQLGVESFQAFCHICEIIWKQSDLMQMLAQKAQLDALTGVMNRRKTMYVLERAIEHSEMTDEPLSVLICRIDGFGELNDLYGWAAADAILSAFAKEASAQMRPQDKAGRWTGVEFLYVLPRADAEEAAALAKRLQDYFLVHPINVKNWSIRLALVVGVATYSKQNVGLDDFVQHASQSMTSATHPATL